MEQKMIFEQNATAQLNEGEAELHKLQAIATQAKTDALARQSFYVLTDALRTSAEAQVGLWQAELADAQAKQKTSVAEAEQQLEILRASMAANMKGVGLELDKLKSSFDKAAKNTWDEQAYKLDLWHEGAQTHLKGWIEDLKEANMRANMSKRATQGQMHHELESIRTDMANEFEAWKHDLHQFKIHSETASAMLEQAFGAQLDKANAQLALLQTKMAALGSASDAQLRNVESDVETAMTQFERALVSAGISLNARSEVGRAKLQLRLKDAEGQIASLENTGDDIKRDKAAAAAEVHNIGGERRGSLFQAVKSQVQQWILEGDAISAKMDATKDDMLIRGSNNIESHEIKNLDAEIEKIKDDKTMAATKAHLLYGKTVELLQQEMKDQMLMWKIDLAEVGVKLGAADAKTYDLAQKAQLRDNMQDTFKGWHAEVVALDKHLGNWTDQAGADLHAEHTHLRDNMHTTLTKWSDGVRAFNAKHEPVKLGADSQVMTDMNIIDNTNLTCYRQRGSDSG